MRASIPAPRSNPLHRFRVDREKWHRQPGQHGRASSFPAALANAASKARSAAIRYARENMLPYLGICLGMQLAVIEFARAMSSVSTVRNSTEFDPRQPHPVDRADHRMAGSRRENRAPRTRASDLGGTMRSGRSGVHAQSGHRRAATSTDRRYHRRASSASL